MTSTVRRTDAPAVSRRHRRRRAVAGMSSLVPACAATATIRQGYQTNMWGMPTYYL